MQLVTTCTPVCVCRDYDEGKSEWVWAREAPASQKAPGGGDAVKKLKKKVGRISTYFYLHGLTIHQAPHQQMASSQHDSWGRTQGAALMVPNSALEFMYAAAASFSCRLTFSTSVC